LVKFHCGGPLAHARACAANFANFGHLDTAPRQPSVAFAPNSLLVFACLVVEDRQPWRDAAIGRELKPPCSQS
jgi:hypothetical protein